MEKIYISSQKREQIIDITPNLRKLIKDRHFSSGILAVFCPHTTAGISVNENADPSVKKDMTAFLNKLIPKDPNFSHSEGNSDAHIKSSIINCAQTFIVENGEIQLGTWQGIFFMEFDGPRNREIWIKY